MEEGNLNYLIVIISVFFGLVILLYILPFGLWFMARISGVRLSLLELSFMKMRSVAPGPIVRSMIMAAKAGIEVRKDELEAHSLAGGSVENVVTDMIIAKKKNVELSFEEACQIDLAHKDLAKDD